MPTASSLAEREEEEEAPSLLESSDSQRDAKPSRPLVMELSSEAAVEEEPSYELTGGNGDGDGAPLKLVVQLPRVAAVGDLDVEMGERAISLRAEGLYKLRLDPLPRPIARDDAKCKFDKKKRVLTVTMPVAAAVEVK